MEEFPAKLRLLIDRKGCTDTSLARHVGVGSPAIARWKVDTSDLRPGESARRPSAAQLLGIARFFEVTMESLADDAIPEPQPVAGQPSVAWVAEIVAQLRDHENRLAAIETRNGGVFPG